MGVQSRSALGPGASVFSASQCVRNTRVLGSCPAWETSSSSGQTSRQRQAAGSLGRRGSCWLLSVGPGARVQGLLTCWLR